MLLQVILVSLKNTLNLIGKGTAYREQNNIDGRVILKNCKAAASRYAQKWARESNVDRRVLRDCEETVLMRRLVA